ncbi:single-stranded DNA-binding protein [Pseudoalteromonas sp. MelDa3]|uniref:single-stranded DNA-binding protein n=1 Tax=Pseudoalteromonas sp. MelDa3 TaxID=888435 RepID=UPI000CB3D1CB|nr:single-stranded DNA-binding protein [Pseudoalteromonas sp. MelDa3]PLT26723.1 single-stranded DNA-binding protein [Pseudoalteromonas sp. MelDa3]
MANDLNQANFIGRLGKDPEIRYTQSGQAAASFSIAVGSKWKDKNTGQQKENTEWVNLVAFGKLAEIMGEYLRKGSQIFVTAKFRTRKWQDQSGADRYTPEFVVENMQMLDSRQDNQHQGNQGNNNYQGQQNSQAQGNNQGQAQGNNSYNNSNNNYQGNGQAQRQNSQGQQQGGGFAPKQNQGVSNSQYMSGGQQGGASNPMGPGANFDDDDIPF